MTRRRHLLVAGLVLAIGLSACGGGKSPTQTPTTAHGTTDPAEAAKQTLCEDLLLIQSGFRPDALTRLLARLKEDRAAFRAAGDQADAKAVAAVAAATTKLRQALLQQQGVPAAQHALQKAIENLPPC